MISKVADGFRRHQGTVLFLWMVLNITWLAVLFVTDLPAWTLAIWIAATVGPLTAHLRRSPTREGPGNPNA